MGEFDQRSVEVLAVVHESLDQLRTVLLASELAFPIGADVDLAVSEAIEIVGIDEFGMRTIRPTAILIRPNGEVAFSYVGDDSIDRLTVPALLLAVDRFA
jgi:peroxiredoxin